MRQNFHLGRYVDDLERWVSAAAVRSGGSRSRFAAVTHKTSPSLSIGYIAIIMSVT